MNNLTAHTVYDFTQPNSQGIVSLALCYFVDTYAISSIVVTIGTHCFSYPAYGFNSTALAHILFEVNPSRPNYEEQLLNLLSDIISHAA